MLGFVFFYSKDCFGYCGIFMQYPYLQRVRNLKSRLKTLYEVTNKEAIAEKNFYPGLFPGFLAEQVLLQGLIFMV